jgi:tRNA G26 N,N-dimethylase Trm1
LEEPDLPFYYELSAFRLERIPKRDRIISALRERGFVAGRTTFSKTGIKSDAPVGEFILKITELTK